MTSREALITKTNSTDSWDVIVIGGGATGLGAAVDSAARGYRTLLLEQVDFSKATSSRSTKLVHGGVRYLQQGNISLVREALHERGLMFENAPHLVKNLGFVVPQYKWWEGPFYGIGLKLYDLLAGKLNFEPSRYLNPQQTIEHIPNLEPDGLVGGTQYYDGQFDDSRMCIALARTALDLNATTLNHAEVTGLIRDQADHVCGVTFEDKETGIEHKARGSVVINATGVFANAVRRMDDVQCKSVVEPSRGVHLVLDASFLAGDTAIMVPHTDDGRVLFVIPWHGRCLVGTTDEKAPAPIMEPRATNEEVDFILRNASRYLARVPQREDIRSVFAGLRPLVRNEGKATKMISREHEILVSRSGLVTVIGGKWTTYRKMADDVMDHAIDVGGLKRKPCVTQHLHIRGYLDRHDPRMPNEDWLRVYGADSREVLAICKETPGGEKLLHPRLPYPKGVVVHAVRHEMARTVEDVLARRTRALLLDAKAAEDCAEETAHLMANELNRDASWVTDQVNQFRELAWGYQVTDRHSQT